VPIVVPPVAGLLAGAAAGASVRAGLWPSLMLLCVCGLTVGLAVRRRLRRAAAVAGAAGGVALGTVLGGHAMRMALTEPLVDAARTAAATASPVMVEGRLRRDAEPTPYGAALTLDVVRLQQGEAWHPTRGGLRVSVGGEASRARLEAWRAGRLVRLPVTFREPAVYGNPGAADPRVDLAIRGVSSLASAKSGLLVDVVEAGGWPAELAAAVRAWTRRRVEHAVGARSPRSAAVVTAILIGDRAGIGGDIDDRLQRAGTFHVIAISGGNIAILTGLLLGMLQAGRLPRQRAALVALAALLAYAGVAGGSPSVGRATLVAALYLGGRACDVSPRPFAVLAAAAALLVAGNPLVVLDVGFTLTCGATAGILLVAPAVLARHASARTGGGVARGFARVLAGLAASTLAAELALLPVAVAVFGRVTVAGLVLNFLAIPMMTIAQAAGLAAVVLDAAWPAAGALAGWVAHAAVLALVESARLVEWLPWLTWRVPSPPPVLILAHYGAWLAWRARLGRTPRWMSRVAMAAGCLATLAIAWPPAWAGLPPRVDPEVRPGRAEAASAWRRPLLSIVALDVGQGDATLVAFPDAAPWLVDAGGSLVESSFDIGARVVAPALWTLGVRRLDRLVLTHGDPDHIGGARAVVEDFTPRDVLEGVPVSGHAGLATLRDLVRRRGIPWRAIRRGERWVVGGVTVHVVHPPDPAWERQRVRNDDSVVLDVRYGAASIVLTGDIGAAAEAEVAPRLSPAAIRVLKVPHHGSAGSSGAALLDAARPAAAFVSAGRHNRFGHPAAAVVERLAARGIPVFRTDRLGALAVTTDGIRVTIEAWDGRAWRRLWAARGASGE
jgi:competence protein ComEC